MYFVVMCKVKHQLVSSHILTYTVKAFMLSRGFRSLSPQLQRLKRSLSFKSVMRSKSVDNFFQRANGESRPPPALIASPPPPQSPPPVSESPLAYERSPSHSPSTSPDPSLTSRSPAASPSKSMSSKAQPKSRSQPAKTHCFQEHVFRRPANCQRCKHMIQGRSGGRCGGGVTCVQRGEALKKRSWWVNLVNKYG